MRLPYVSVYVTFCLLCVKLIVGLSSAALDRQHQQISKKLPAGIASAPPPKHLSPLPRSITALLPYFKILVSGGTAVEP